MYHNFHTFQRFTIISMLALGWGISQSVIAAPSSNDQEIMTLNEAAIFLRVSSSAVEKLTQEHEIPAQRIGTQWRFSRTSLIQWLTGTKSQTSSVPTKLLPKVKTSQLVSQKVAQNKTNSTDKPNNTPHSVGDKTDQKTAEEVFLRDQGVLLKAGQITMEADLFYSKSEQNGLFSGLTTQDTFTSNYSLRYGLWDDLQFSASIPLHYQTNTAVYDLQTSEKSTNTRWGDFSLSLRQVAIKEGVGYPSIILSLDTRIPTNHDNYAAGGTISLSKSLDPAVLFGSFSYLHTFPGTRESLNLDVLQVENTFSGTMGIAYALNDSLVLSTALSGVITRFTQPLSVPQERYSLQFGLTSLLTERLYIEPTVSFGLNNPSSKDVSFGVSIPYTF